MKINLGAGSIGQNFEGSGEQGTLYAEPGKLYYLLLFVMAGWQFFLVPLCLRRKRIVVPPMLMCKKSAQGVTAAP